MKSKNVTTEQIALQNVVVYEMIGTAVVGIQKAKALLAGLPRPEDTKVEPLEKLQTAYDALRAIKL